MLRLTVVGMALLCSAAGGDERYGPNPYAAYQPQIPDYVEKPYTPLYPSSYRQYSRPSVYPAQPEYPYSAYETTSESPYSYQQPSYKPKPKQQYAEPYPSYKQEYKKQEPYAQPSNYGSSSYGDAYPSSEPQGYPAATQYKPQPAYQTASSYAGAYKPAEPKAPALAAVCDFSTGAGSGKVQGRLTLTQAEGGYDDPIHISGTISNLSPGEHGFHVHMYGDFSDGCTSAGGHFNPYKVSHGPKETDKNHRHLGDLGNIVADYYGVAKVNLLDHLVSLANGGKHPVGGRAIVVHEKPDDLGRGGNEESKKTGNAGARLGCCVITMVDPSKLKNY